MGWILLGWKDLPYCMTLSRMNQEPKYPSPLRESYAARVWLFRNAQDLSQVDFARIVGVDRTTISQIELGKANISLDLLERFWRVLSSWDRKPKVELFKPLGTDSEPLVLRQKFGLRFRKVREERGFTQEKLGPLVGFDHKMIGRIERGEHSTALDQIQKLCDFLEVSAEDLLECSLIDVFGVQ